MKYLIILFFIINLIRESAKAQIKSNNFKGRIIGTVKDANTNLPIEYATIQIYKQGVKAPFNGTVSDNKGNFNIGNIQNGEFQLSVEFIGYKRQDIANIIISDTKPEIRLNTLTITPITSTLNVVNITGQASTVVNKIDKMVYNVGNDLTSQGGVATDVLKKVPMVTVDIDGNVELLGNPSIKFLINGKPSSIFGASLSDALQSIPASQIKSIEIITSPGAKYDASGTGGIINIILKDNKVQGYNGSVSLTAGTRLENGSVNLNLRKSNFGINAHFSGNATLRSKTLNTRDRLSSSNDTIQHQTQNGIGYLQRSGFQSGVSINWDITKKDNFITSINYNHISNQIEGLTNQEDQGFIAGNLLSDILSNRSSNSTYSENAVDFNLEYKKTFKKENQEFDIAYTTSLNKNNTDYYQKIDFTNINQPSTGSNGNNPGRDRVTEIAIDYAYPIIKDIILETGAKVNFERITSTSIINTFNNNSNNFIYDSLQSNTFNYSRNVYSYYISGSFSAFHFFDMKIGLRDEYSTTSVDFAGTSIPNYNILAPSFLASHKLSKSQTIKFSYGKRIERPDFGDINPFINYSDPYNISFGNPKLHPEIGDQFQIGYSQSFQNASNINITALYEHNGFDIKRYTYRLDSLIETGGSIYKNVYLTTRSNVGAEVKVGVNISSSILITNHFTLRPNILFLQRRVMIILPNVPNFVRGYDYRLNLNGTYQFKYDLAVEVFANYNAPQISIQGKNPSFAAYSFAFKKQFLNKKASLGFTTTVPFNDYINQATTIVQPGDNQYSLRRVPYRSFGLSFSYKFGKLAFKKAEEKDSNLNISQPVD